MTYSPHLWRNNMMTSNQRRRRKATSTTSFPLTVSMVCRMGWTAVVKTRLEVWTVLVPVTPLSITW